MNAQKYNIQKKTEQNKDEKSLLLPTSKNKKLKKLKKIPEYQVEMALKWSHSCSSLDSNHSVFLRRFEIVLIILVSFKSSVPGELTRAS